MAQHNGHDPARVVLRYCGPMLSQNDINQVREKLAEIFGVPEDCVTVRSEFMRHELHVESEFARERGLRLEGFERSHQFYAFEHFMSVNFQAFAGRELGVDDIEKIPGRVVRYHSTPVADDQVSASRPNSQTSFGGNRGQMTRPGATDRTHGKPGYTGEPVRRGAGRGAPFAMV